MRTSCKLLLCSTTLVVAIIAVAPQYYLWPPVLRRCSLGDPDLDDCLLKATEFALSKVSRGLSVVGLNSLDPLRNAKFTASNDRWPVSLTLEADRISIMGPSKVHIRSVTFDRRSGTYTIQGFHESLRMVGNYRMRGSVLLFPLNSAGTFDMELLGALANHSLKLTGNTRDAAHGQVGFTLISLNNLRVGLRDPNLGMPANRAINRLVNDNWKIISRALTPSVERAIHDIYSAALQPLTSKFNVYDFFPDNNVASSDDDENVNDDDDDDDNDDDDDDDDEDSEQEQSEQEEAAEVEVPVMYSYYTQWK